MGSLFLNKLYMDATDKMAGMVGRCPQAALVSVVMPTYNQAKYIGESIESVLKQTHNNLELVIIDNYSDDGTERIVTEYARKDPRIRYRRFRNHGFVANSRNLGIEMAEGIFVAFIDSDDLWHRQKLERMLPLFEDPDVGFVFTRINEIDAEGNIIRDNALLPMFRGRVLERLLKRSFFIPTCSVVLRRQLLDQHRYRFRTNRQGSEDYDLWIRIAEVSKGDYVDESLASYRVHSENESRNYVMMFRSKMTTLDDYEKHIERNYSSDDMKRKLLLKACRIGRIVSMTSLVHHQLGDGYYRKACQVAMRVIAIRPIDTTGWKLLARTCIYPLWRGTRRIMWGSK